jgi:hypothetical protein
MSNITLEQIDLIVARTNVSFTDARAALEQANGDIVEALLLLEKEQKAQPNINLKKPNVAKKNAKDFLAKLHATRFILKKKEMTYINIPLSVALLAIIFSFHFLIVALVVALVYGIKIEIKGNNDLAEKINQTAQKLQ